jgi:hypothetical protein
LDIDDEMEEDLESDPELDLDSSGEIVYAMWMPTYEGLSRMPYWLAVEVKVTVRERGAKFLYMLEDLRVRNL